MQVKLYFNLFKISFEIEINIMKIIHKISYASELSIQLRDDLDNGFHSASEYRNDVPGSLMAIRL